MIFIFVVLVTKLFTTGYLLIYNGVQWSGFFLILVNIILLTLKGKGKKFCDKKILFIFVEEKTPMCVVFVVGNRMQGEPLAA